MSWFYLLAAGACEIGWLVAMKFSAGFTRLWPSLTVVVLGLLSLYLLSLSIRTLPVGTAYAVWTGIGAAGSALIGVLLFGEPKTALRLLSITLVVAGIVGLKLSSEAA